MNAMSVVIVSIGIILVAHFAYIFVISKRSKKWKIIEGEIIISKMDESTLGEGVQYKAIIHYKYTIEKKEYFSNRIFYGDYIERNFSKSVKSLVNKYRQGEKVLVFYNPLHPSWSVLESGVHIVIYRELLAGILLIFFAILMFMKNSLFS